MFSSLTTKLAMRKAGISMKDISFQSEKKPKGEKMENSENGGLPFANPFASMTLPKSLQTWQTPPPPPVELAPTPIWGKEVPSCPKLELPCEDGRPAVIVFMRHCGCPFAEKIFIELRRLANKYPDIAFFAISHSPVAETTKWIHAVGGAWTVQVIIDEERELYAKWGLGVANTWHVLSPWTQWNQYKLGKEEGVWGREASGNHWQIGGSWAVDEKGLVRWGSASKSADDIPNLVDACMALGYGGANGY